MAFTGISLNGLNRDNAPLGRLALGLAFAVVLLLACGQPAFSAQSLSVTLSTTTAGTAAEPAPLTLTGDFTASPAVPTAPERVTSLVFTVPAGITMGGAPSAPSCGAATVSATPDLCPTGSRVGFGTHDVIVGGAPVTATVTAFNAPGGQSLNMLSQALGTSLVTTATLDGTKRTLTTQWAPAPAPAMQLTGTRFTFAPAPGATTSWVTATGCAGGTWSFSNTVNGSDGTSPSAGVNVPCTQGTGFVPPRRPRVWTASAEFGAVGSAKVGGGVNAQGATTTYFVQYGETTAYGRQTPPATTTATQPNAWWLNGGFPGAPIERTVGGLADGTDYHARMVAVNAGGTTYGNDVRFTTNDPDRNPAGCPFGPGLTDGWRSDYFTGGWGWDSVPYEAISAHVILWWNPIVETVHWGDGSSDESFNSSGNTQSHLFPHQYTWDPSLGNPNVRAPRIDHEGTYNLNVNVDCAYAHRGWPLTLWGSFAGPPLSVSGLPHDGEITATWAPPATSGGSPITQYTAIASPGGRMCTAGGNPPHNCDIEGLANGTAYSVSVFATTAAGEGHDSATSPPVTPASVPGPPGTPIATAGPGPGEATVTWTTPATTGGSPITGYETTASPGGNKCTTSGPIASCKVAGLANGTAYTFKVLAKNAIGSGPQSASSNSITLLGKPGAPGSVTAVAGNANATVSFTAPPATVGGAPVTSYVVTASPHGQQCFTTTLSCLAEDLDNGIAYTFTVVAMSSVGDGPPSSPSNSVTPAGPPGPPKSVTGTPGDGQVSVSWLAANNAGSPVTGYTVTASPGGAQCTTSGALGCAVTGLVNGTPYTFTVVATNVHGNGPPSAPSSQATPAAPVVPPAPPPPPPPAPPLVPPAPGPGLTLPSIVATKTLTATVAPGGTITVAVSVTCPEAASGPCTVTVTILSASAARSAASGEKYTLKPGATIKPKVKLNSKTLKRLRRAGRLKLRVRVTVRAAGGTAPTSKVVSMTVRRR